MTNHSNQTTATQLWFTAPFKVETREMPLAALQADEVLVESEYSAVSPGTELLLYRGQLPQTMALDSTIESLQDSAEYPLQYGYACVGVVSKLGSEVDPTWQGKRVFSFAPHASHFIARPDQLIAVPGDITAQAAVFLPNMETAVNLVQDGLPMMGERVAVLGQGVVGLLLTGLLAKHPLASLIGIEGQPDRQAFARSQGATEVLAPNEAAQRLSELPDVDLIFEVSGHLDALDLAISLSGYTSRVVIGSWYGNKTVSVDLGGAAHRNRLQLITSQVSTIAPELSGRWNKQRRYDLAWDMIRAMDPTQFVTHIVSLNHAGELYQQLHEGQSSIVQPLFGYASNH